MRYRTIYMTLARGGGRESSKKVRIWPKNDQCATLDFINSLLSVIIPYQHISKSSWGPWTRCKTFWRRRISCSTRSPSESWRLSFFEGKNSLGFISEDPLYFSKNLQKVTFPSIKNYFRVVWPCRYHQLIALIVNNTSSICFMVIGRVDHSENGREVMSNIFTNPFFMGRISVCFSVFPHKKKDFYKYLT